MGNIFDIPKYHKITVYYLLIFTAIFLLNKVAYADSLTSKPCPYSCKLIGLSANNCRDYRVGNTCYVESLSKNTDKRTKNQKVCLNSLSGEMRVREKCNSKDGESEATLANFKGEKGEKGESGEKGAKGDTGEKGEKGEQGIQGLTGATGPVGLTGLTGATGTAGADGSIRIYGDGSAGDQTISANAIFNSDNTQYENFTVMNGVTLTVPSGTVIRCSGSFFNQGNINVLPALRQHPKVSENGQVASGLQSGGNEAVGGIGGTALPEGAAKQIIRAGFLGGGDGYKLDSEAGSSGGGNLVILCKNGISNLVGATITADGLDGGDLSRGGGGGGIVILASQSSVVNQGTIFARGGSGADLNSDNGSNTGYAAGGGACGGDGGDGGKVNEGLAVDNSASAGEDGTNGKVFLNPTDPTSLY